MTTYNKLVRDRIPETLEKSGETFDVETLNHDRFIVELRKKLQEEFVEYQDAASDEEAIRALAGMLEAIHALADVHDANFEDVEAARKRLADEYGGYKDKLFLKDVEDSF